MEGHMIRKILDMSTLDKSLLNELDDYILSLEGKKEEHLIHVLHKAQSLFGYLPQNLQLYIARKLDLPAARVNGVVTFYSFFNEKPVGKYTISVCMGTACFVKGADKVLDRVMEVTGTKKGEMSKDGLFTIKDVRCIGACGLAPVLTINDKVYGKVKPKDVDDIIRHYRSIQNDRK
ncbi:NAD(P)H-dependent oxidoreductase subunit E [Hujiaoplasma nucleasis]|uniref:NAD(P)H-dependent oxidoreductase subunit E n=2 Tax=Hujiaoplasma nucleasis TaxID=2725268 RepID=A0A7L6N3J4_9MOLU|nr:NAD(P)H-dependent oxidoreductase subunit E [Hujiaoplasma nucleasis]